ncbi:MAG: hypothetical protein PHT07_15215 [Paludibacter sp.]|nr:hypothetical protein [Paludibacter sp.]
MSILSANQLYQLSGTAEQGVKFKDWLNSEKDMYQSKINAGKITGQMLFPEWLNKRWVMKATMSAEGDATGSTFGKKLIDALKNVGTKTLQKTVAGKTDSAAATTDAGKIPGEMLQEKRILGMKPGVAYAVGGVLFLAATVTAIYIIRRAKKAA